MELTRYGVCGQKLNRPPMTKNNQPRNPIYIGLILGEIKPVALDDALQSIGGHVV